jgi:hypothetical protein
MIKFMHCEIRVKGHLSSQWTDWFGGLEIKNQPGGEAVLSGSLPDQAALYGVLNRMRDLGLVLVSLNCVESGPDETSTLQQAFDCAQDRAQDTARPLNGQQKQESS